MKETLNELSFHEEILRTLPDPIVWAKPVLNESGNIIDFEVAFSNHKADAIIGHPLGSLTGLQFKRDGVPTIEMAEQNFQHYLKVYQTETSDEFTFKALGSNVETIRRKFRDGVLSIVRDRKAQRDAEQKEQEKTQLLNGVVNNAPLGIEVYEAIRNSAGEIIDFQIKLFNNTLHQITGVPQAERSKLTFKELLKELVTEEIFESYKNTVETGQPFSFEFLSPIINRWLHLSVVKLGDGFLIMISDINEVKTLQKDLERSAERFKTVVNSSQAGIFTLLPERNEGGEIIDFRFGIVNESVANYVGQTAEKLTGALGSEYFPAYKTNGLFDLYKDSYNNSTQHNFDFHYEDGYDKFFNINVVKMGEEVLVTFTDHTTLKKLQWELETKLHELERSNQSLEEFAYAASHDLQEPLRKIHTFSDRLKNELIAQMNSNQQRMFERIENATQRMKALIQDLLAYSQLSASPFELKPVKLDNIVQQVLQDLEAVITETDAKIEVKPLPEINGDERQLRQLFQNLIGNAIKYRKADVQPEILLQSRKVNEGDEALKAVPETKKGNCWLIEIKDNGIGFDQEHAQKIFQVFQRLHGRSEYEGTGVGLSIVQKVVTNHKGYIWAESEPEKGASFKVLLPVNATV